jgi:hypothetical protein
MGTLLTNRTLFMDESCEYAIKEFRNNNAKLRGVPLANMSIVLRELLAEIK